MNRSFTDNNLNLRKEGSVSHCGTSITTIMNSQFDKSFANEFSFSLPTKIIFGAGCVSKLPEVLAEYGIKYPLIITDKGIVNAGIAGKVEAMVPDYVLFSGVEANPKDENVKDATIEYKNGRNDGIIAVGGGSAIDCAKAVGVLAANNTLDIRPFEDRSLGVKPLPPLISIPTTAGTGSEVTFSSVITNTKGHYKMTIKNAFTAPTVALCDPELTLSVPPSVTASTGMDALTHAIEGYTATCSNSIADSVALYAMQIIYANLETAVNYGEDLEARSAMLMGSLLAGIAFSHSDVGSVHCIAEALGGKYDLAHGTCNAVILPYMMEYNKEYCVKRYAKCAEAFGLPVYGFTDEEKAKAAVEAVRELAQKVGLPKFSELGVNEKDFPALAMASYKNGSTPSNPRKMGVAEYTEVLKIMQGTK
ncbi:MAG: iron-containing alcohol dehydrogenase [Lachnospiraceae bacterium]|jgi:alcohol dehydrogenase|nr:iron-containing alcohol dehydrogenase [Lachnospiraceae bacterium]